MGLSPEQLTIEAPVVSIVEVKNEDTTAGIAQCLAEMIAARIFNEQRKKPISTAYGVVITGSVWRFLRLFETIAFIDVSEYHIKELERIVGIIVSMMRASGVPESP